MKETQPTEQPNSPENGEEIRVFVKDPKTGNLVEVKTARELPPSKRKFKRIITRSNTRGLRTSDY